jgi:hypothetical protein
MLMWCVRQSIAEVMVLVCGVSVTYADMMIAYRLFKIGYSFYYRGDLKDNDIEILLTLVADVVDLAWLP